MKNLRLWIVLFAIILAIFFNIERLDFGEENIVDIDTFVYVLAAVAVTVIITVPLLRRLNVAISILFWIAVYIAGKLLLGRPILGGVYTYLSITELSLLLMVIWATHKLTYSMNDFEEAVQRVTFSDNGNRRIRPIEEAYDEIQIEMFRSRHYHHPLSVIVVEPELGSIQSSFHHLVQEIQRSMMSSYIINNMAHTLGKYMRRTDFVLEQREQRRFIILCPDTNGADLSLMVEYVQSVAKEQLGTKITCGVATFPDEAITFEELLHKAEGHLNSTNRNS